MKVAVLSVGVNELEQTIQEEKDRGAKVLALAPSVIKKGVVIDYVVVVGL